MRNILRWLAYRGFGKSIMGHRINRNPDAPLPVKPEQPTRTRPVYPTEGLGDLNQFVKYIRENEA